jgi:hypothetical protein
MPTGGRVGLAVLSMVGNSGIRVGVAGMFGDELHAVIAKRPSSTKVNRRIIILPAQLSYEMARKANRADENAEAGFLKNPASL